MTIYLNGLILGLSLVMSLGPQNIFLIRQGALRNHAILSALICFFCDIILIYASVAGLHKALELHPTLNIWMTWFGVVFLLYYGGKTLLKSFKQHGKETITGQRPLSNRLQIIVLALSFSLLNPHAIIDTLVIIGGNSSQFPDHPYIFSLGVLSASFLWLTSLTFTTHYFSNVLVRCNVWRRIEYISGLVLLVLSFKLACSQI